jgi:hypothetical protein
MQLKKDLIELGSEDLRKILEMVVEDINEFQEAFKDGDYSYSPLHKINGVMAILGFKEVQDLGSSLLKMDKLDVEQLKEYSLKLSQVEDFIRVKLKELALD